MRGPVALRNLLVAVAAIGFYGTGIAGQRPEPVAIAAGDQARIVRIERGLLPAVAIRGTARVSYALADRMAHHNVPAVSVAFVENGRIAWAKAYGSADIARNTPATPATLFQAASISKPLTALAALRLVQDGRLALDDDVNMRLTSWKVPENEFTGTQKVTLRRLLSHSAGMTVSGFPGYAATAAVPTVIQVLNGEKPANTAPIRVDVEPGKIWRYSGGGFTVVQLLVTDLTEKRFPQVMQEMVLGPAGMVDSTYEQPLPRPMAARAATPYRRSGEPVPDGPHTYAEMAAAGLWTTPSDLARAAIEIDAAFAGTSTRIVSQATVQQMLTVQRDGFGLGIGVNGRGSSLRFGHGGANEGYRCELVHYPERHQGIAVMTNSDSGGLLIAELIRAVSAEYGWPDFKTVEHTLTKVDPAILASYVGAYESTGVGPAAISQQDGRLFLQVAPLGPRPVAISPETPTDFFLLDNTSTVRFVTTGSGAVDALVVQMGQQTMTLKKVK